MSRNYTTNAINLSAYDLSENDKIVVMYSKEKGLIKGVAKGCKKPKSKLGAMMQALVANRIILNKGRSLDIISQSEAVESFKGLKKDFNKLSLSMYCAEIVSNYGIEEDSNSEDIYNLLYNVLSSVAEAKTTTELFLSVMKFQLKIMDMAGFQICLDLCSNCGSHFNENNSYKFSISTGGILCNECYKKLTAIRGKTVSINSKIVKFLSAIKKTDFKERTKYDDLVTEKICIICFNLLKDYISYHSSKKFKTVEMLELSL